MAISISYSYKVDAKFVLGDKEEQILPEGISTIITNYDYDNNNIPIIYLGVNLETSLYNRMVQNTEKGTIVLTVSKAKNGSNYSFFTDYIKGSFTYIMSTNPDYNTTLEQQSGTKDQIGVNFRQGYLALILNGITDNNRKNMNTIIKNSNMTSIINKFTSHMKMVMEPLHTDKLFKYLIIEPVESIPKLLDFLMKKSVFYRNGFRYFVDFNRTYLLSGQGNPVEAKDNTYSTVIINVIDPADIEAHQTGVITDHANKAYILNINAHNTSTDVKKSDEKIFNTITGVDSYGNTKEVNLNIPKTQGSSTKARLERVPSDNMEYIDYMQSQIEDSVLLFSVTKTEIDTSLITPNKEYVVRNFPTYEQYNGNYVLSYKKDTFINQNNQFISSILFGLRKVKSTTHTSTSGREHGGASKSF